MERSTHDDGRVLDCPVCGIEMLVEKVGHVRVDVCDDHGMWLDGGELERIKLKENRERPRYSKKHEKKGRLARWLDGLEDLFD